jgi:UTP--glucose-1-phosphate uridylyltransferase
MIKKAVITTAGFGTRFLPISKTIQKEMLPILDRPLVDYVVEDLVKAGIQEIIFVINEHNFQIKHYYSENLRLYRYLEKMDKLAAYEQVVDIHTRAKFTFVVQPDEEQYGTAMPVKLCQEHLQDEEAFLVFMGDDFIYHQNGQSEAAAMIELYQRAKKEMQSKISGLATFITRPEEELHKYGIAEVEEKNDFKFVKKLIEKPAPGTAPSNLSNISKYIFTPEVFTVIDQQQPNPKSGELYITDTVEQLAQKSGIVAHLTLGEYLDGGEVTSWLKANLRLAWEDKELKAKMEKWIEELRVKNNITPMG